MLLPQPPTPLTRIVDDVTEATEVVLYVKRDDLIHPIISGNKWRKLKYNLVEARNSGVQVLVTFGGAHSNHLSAVATAGLLAGIKTVGFVRGDELNAASSPTLAYCHSQKMMLIFLDRSAYRLKEKAHDVEEYLNVNKSAWVLPEGGSNQWALPGVAEMVLETREQLGLMPTAFAVACGTGGTAAGMLSAGALVAAFSVLKNGGFLRAEIHRLLGNRALAANLDLRLDYHFGGYAKKSASLVNFIKRFEATHRVPLEPVYTGKMMYGVYDLIKSGVFPKKSVVVAVHTGGLTLS